MYTIETHNKIVEQFGGDGDPWGGSSWGDTGNWFGVGDDDSW
jgi:hypothetical protein